MAHPDFALSFPEKNQHELSRSADGAGPLVYIVLILLAFLCIFPLWTLLVNMTREPWPTSRAPASAGGLANYLSQNWNKAFSDAHLPLGSALRNSFIVSISVTILTCYFSCLTAYAFNVYSISKARMHFSLHHAHHDDPDSGECVGLRPDDAFLAFDSIRFGRSSFLRFARRSSSSIMNQYMALDAAV
jgi:hypothetical protein